MNTVKVQIKNIVVRLTINLNSADASVKFEDVNLEEKAAAWDATNTMKMKRKLDMRFMKKQKGKVFAPNVIEDRKGLFQFLEKEDFYHFYF